MNTYQAVRTRLMMLCEEKHMTINRLATESAVPVSTIKATQEIGTFLALFKNGGIAGKAANALMVPGNNYSGDRIPVLVNSGELILNRAQQGNIASQLQGGAQNLNLDAVITGEQIRLVLNNNGRRTGRGEYVQTNRR